MRLVLVGLALFVLGACGEDFDEGSPTGAGGSIGAGGAGGAMCDVESVATCTDDPWTCHASNQTCWLNAAQTGYECLNPGPGAEGDACDPIAGQPRCGVGLSCLMVMGDTTGTCRQYCSQTDPCKACPAGQNCLNVVTPVSTPTLICSP
jgi:hypothetical protein